MSENKILSENSIINDLNFLNDTPISYLAHLNILNKNITLIGEYHESNNIYKGMFFILNELIPDNNYKIILENDDYEITKKVNEAIYPTVLFHHGVTFGYNYINNNFINSDVLRPIINRIYYQYKGIPTYKDKKLQYIEQINEIKKNISVERGKIDHYNNVLLSIKNEDDTSILGAEYDNYSGFTVSYVSDYINNMIQNNEQTILSYENSIEELSKEMPKNEEIDKKVYDMQLSQDMKETIEINTQIKSLLLYKKEILNITSCQKTSYLDIKVLELLNCIKNGLSNSDVNIDTGILKFCIDISTTELNIFMHNNDKHTDIFLYLFKTMYHKIKDIYETAKKNKDLFIKLIDKIIAYKPTLTNRCLTNNQIYYNFIYDLESLYNVCNNQDTNIIIYEGSSHSKFKFESLRDIIYLFSNEV